MGWPKKKTIPCDGVLIGYCNGFNDCYSTMTSELKKRAAGLAPELRKWYDDMNDMRKMEQVIHANLVGDLEGEK